jgi:hypothetical protein
VATGSRPRLDGVHYNVPARTTTGVNQKHVVSSWTALSDRTREFGEHVVISDDTGHHEAAAAAAFFIASGRIVTFLTSHGQFAPGLAGSFAVTPLLERLTAGNFTLRTRAVLKHIVADAVVIEPLDGGPAERQQADTVVLVSPNLPTGIPAPVTTGSSMKVYTVGDASSPRFLDAAVGDAFRLGMMA